jgi:mannose/fructose/N-acetylgalactosamine-specific phosphotransferase system component IID
VTFLRGLVRFWWDFVVGDEWRLAVIVAVATALGVVAAIDGRVRGEVIACSVAAVVMVAFCDVVIAAGRRARR